MSIKYIIIVLGEPYSTFSEIIGKYYLKNKNPKLKIILIGDLYLLKNQLTLLKYNLQFNKIENIKDSKKNKINIINIKFKHKKTFAKISEKSNIYIKKCFDEALKIIQNHKNECILINGPISKKYFLKKKYSGITEYLSKKTFSKNEVMLIFNKKISVSPLTTHIPIKFVAKKITKEKIINNILKLNNFYKNNFNKKIKFAVLGLNPHCETIDNFSEEEKVIIPAIKSLKQRGINVNGPFSSDTFFFHKNLNYYDVVVGMYHDQVLTPIKTLFNFKAINITVGLPFIRISPDHGPNSEMLGKNKSDPSSLMYAIKFIQNIK